MKRKSKFYRPAYEDGGLLQNQSFLSGVGGTASVLTNLIPSASKINNQFAGDERYMREMQKASAPANALNTLGSAAMSTGNPFAMAGGLTLQGISKLVGKKATRKAETSAFNRAQDSSIAQNLKLGALTSNAIPKFKAPAYGRLGMKFKSKFNRE